MEESILMMRDGIRPNIIANEYNKMYKIALEKIKTKYAVNVLETNAVPTLTTKIQIDRSYLLSLAKTTLQTRLDRYSAKEFAEICVQATEHIYQGATVESMRNEHDRQKSKIHIVGQSDLETSIQLINGIVIEQGVRDINMPMHLQSCKILLIDEPLELTDAKTTLHASKMEFSSAKERVELVQSEREVIDRKVQKIIQSGSNVLLSLEAIDAISLSRLANAGIIALRHVSKQVSSSVMEATGAKIVRSIMSQEFIFGFADQVHVQEHEENLFYTYLTGVKNARICTILVKGPTHHTVRASYNAVQNTLSVLRNTFEDCMLVPGGGSLEMSLAADVRKIDTSDLFETRIKEAFASALENGVPLALCQNSGFSVYQVLSEWKVKCQEDSLYALDLYHPTGAFIDPKKCGIWDSARVKLQALVLGIETCSVLLKIDCIAKAGDLRKHSVVVPIQENKKQWKYNRYRPGLDNPGKWSKREKEKVQKSEDRFYSEEERERRKKIEKFSTVENNDAKRVEKLKHATREEAQRQRLREAGYGYEIDPFQ
jgi:chaperonin GroEL (HSP60 family)